MAVDDTFDRTVTRGGVTRDPGEAGEPWAAYLRLVFAEHLALGEAPTGQIHPLSESATTALTIGRRPPAGRGALALSWDRSASRSHARVAMVPGGPELVVADLESRNGTFINGQRIDAPTPVSPGDAIRIGGSIFVVGRARLLAREALLASHPPPPWLTVWSAATVALWDRIVQSAGSDVGVLLGGEMGTGKTRLAETIHELGPRAKAPFVPFNCSAIPHHLEEATLFGVVGGFIPGVKQRDGWLTAAGEGTLFLDEMADLPMLAQTKLLSAFDTRNAGYMPVGSNRRLPTRCRLVSATNRDVFGLAREGALRQDLLSRLVTGHIEVPPLRERREEILETFRKLLVQHRAATEPSPVARAELAEALLLAHWTENIRGLETLATRVAAGETLTAESVRIHADRGMPAASGPVSAPAFASPARAAAAASAPPPPWPPGRAELLKVLAAHDWAINLAAEALGRRRETVSRLVKSLFGAGGRTAAQAAWRVWQASGRLPEQDQMEHLQALYGGAADTPEIRAARRRWESAGELP